MNIPLIALTGNPNSSLAQAATIHIDVSVEKEACPLGLAPTSSTTAMLVMGDALAIALLEAKGFTAEDFALSHPGGSLGKRLLLKVHDVMRTNEQIPIVTGNTLLSDALVEISRKGLGMTAVINETRALIGIFTDGDLRRTLDLGVDIHQTTIADVMTKNCKTISKDILAFDAFHTMKTFKITSLVIVNQNHNVEGVIHIHDLLRAGVS